MTKKQYCDTHKSIAYYSGLNGFEVKGFEYGINDYMYAISNCWYNHKNLKYHKLLIRYDSKGNSFVVCNGYKIPLNECIRMDLASA